MKKAVFLLLLPLYMQAITAEEQADDGNAVASSRDLTLQVSTLPEMKLGFTQRFSFPFLQGDSPLTVYNNIGLALSVEISPISLNGLAEVVWTPIAFLQIAAGGRIGSGWNLNLFGSDIYGIGVNHPNSKGNGENSGNAFDGLLWKTQTGGAFQFDLAALYPGDWHHVVARSYHEVNYKGYSRAKEGESWFYENDWGENCNGFNYYGNMLVGYQMPLFFNMAALLAEMDLYLYDTPDRDKWGDDKIRWTFSAIFGFTITKQCGLNLITQFITLRNFQESNWRDLYYRSRTIESSRPLRLEFYRVAAALTYQF